MRLRGCAHSPSVTQRARASDLGHRAHWRPQAREASSRLPLPGPLPGPLPRPWPPPREPRPGRAPGSAPRFYPHSPYTGAPANDRGPINTAVRALRQEARGAGLTWRSWAAGLRNKLTREREAKRPESESQSQSRDRSRSLSRRAPPAHPSPPAHPALPEPPAQRGHGAQQQGESRSRGPPLPPGSKQRHGPR